MRDAGRTSLLIEGIMCAHVDIHRNSWDLELEVSVIMYN